MDLSNCFYIFCLALFSSCLAYKDYIHLGGGYQQPTRESRITTRSVCGNVPGLTQKQMALCIEDPHAVASAIQGLHVGIHECKRQFKNHRWNCSSLETKNNMPLNSVFLKRAAGNKESSFAYAITAAGVAHQVAHACSLGMIHDCHCPLSAGRRKKIKDRFSAADRFRYFGCNHNINYAINYSVKFLDPDAAKDTTSRVRQHNNRVGRLIVGKNMIRACRCHGISGSCNQETCWYQTPNFREVGQMIKEKYETALLHEEIPSNNVRPNSPSPMTSNEALLYYEKSPSYCHPNHKIAVAGTKGRICNQNAHPDDPSSCENLCCRRGHRTFKEVRHEKCHCRFHWCCYVECQNCTVSEKVSVCR